MAHRRAVERPYRAAGAARLAGLVVLLAAGAACRPDNQGPPVIVVDRTACDRCGMLVSEPLYAAAYRRPGEAPLVFDDLACLLESAARETEPATLVVWVHDAETGAWIDGHAARFVRAATLSTPMGGGFLAFGDARAAEAAAAARGGRTAGSLRDLLAGTGS